MMKRQARHSRPDGNLSGWSSGVCLFLLFIISLLGVAFSSCSSIDCPVQNTVYTVYNFYSSQTGEEVSVLDTLSVWTRRSDGTDTTLFNRGVGTSSLDLPISYTHPEDTLMMSITTADGLLGIDTIWVKKDSYPHFESVDCSAAFFHRITAVRSTNLFIDSIVINNPTVNYDASKEHFHVYFKTGD